MAEFDTVIIGGTIVDGQGMPRYKGDVGIKDGKVAHLGGQLSPGSGDNVIDAAGMIVAPGFIDLHTHYDAQVFWDPYCSISGWHGVTSLVFGNCGFGFAPVAAENQERAMLSMVRNEAIPLEALREGLPWDWTTFPEYLDSIERTPKGVNMLPYVPIAPLITWVMGLEEAKSRHATAEENAEMARLLREAMQAGGCGWSAQRTPPDSPASSQRDYDGTPMVTDLMSDETAIALAEVLAELNLGHIQMVLGTTDPVHDRQHLEDLAQISGRPLLFNGVLPNANMPQIHRDALAWLHSCNDRGIRIYGQGVTADGGYTFTLEDWNMWDESDAWREVLLGEPAERLAKLTDPSRLGKLKANPPMLFTLDTVSIIRTHHAETKQFQDARLSDAAETLGMDLVDALIHISKLDELKTLLWVPQGTIDDDAAIKELLDDPWIILGPSDGGAHLKFITTARYPTQTITDYVRDKGLMSLEHAHWRLSALPAWVAGFRERGQLRVGWPADVLVYDYDNLACGPEEVLHDLPGGGWRRVQRAIGYKAIMVNGQVTFEDGKETGATPGRLLRHGIG